MTRKLLISLLAAVLALVSCTRDGLELDFGVGPFGEETRKVLLLYEAGFNSLDSDLANNINTLQKGWLPGKTRSDDVLLVFSHLTSKRRTYGVETAPVLIRMYQEHDLPVLDTLRSWPVGTPVANAEMVTEVFTLVRELFPAASYGAVLSSHATGWLPEGYFSSSKKYEGYERGASVISWAPPQRRSFGQEYYDKGAQTEEIEIQDLAAAIPYRLDYLLFDACLMATVEVAWQLRDVCSYLAAAPCEIPSAGFDYSTLTTHLLKPESPDLKAVCEDYFARYEHDSTYGAAITMVDCGELDGLASVCRTLFDRYRTAIRTVDGSRIQVYDRTMSGKYYYVFFDVEDLLRQSGASEEDLALLRQALDEAIVYEAHTSRFINLGLERCCGLAMYLPSYPDGRKDSWHGTPFLDGFYKENISWNDATGLVE